MSRLTDLIRQAKAKDAQFGADLEAEFNHMRSRLAFGLNFERHQPEAVELPQRSAKRGDKVRILRPRGETKKGDRRLWRITWIEESNDRRTAHLESIDASAEDTQVVDTNDIVVVAEFHDPVYPGLRSTGTVEQGGDKPYHIVINGENYYALEMLTYTHRGRIDVIYVDPPYNTGAHDWKYNNDYVDEDDLYQHSKWLAMMERRLLLAKELLRPDGSVLIATIDEKEYLRLGLLLEQVFSGARIQMVSSMVNPNGTSRVDSFNRVDEYIFFVRIGSVPIAMEPIQGNKKARWDTYRRHNPASERGRKGKGACGPNQFYPIYIEQKSGRIVAVGEPVPYPDDRHKAPQRDGCVAVFPVRDDGTEMNWSATPAETAKRIAAGYIRVGAFHPDRPQPYVITGLYGGTIKDIEDGNARVTHRRRDGTVEVEYVGQGMSLPTTQWQRPSHNARTGGTDLLPRFIPGRKFPYPKSLYAVEDALQFFVKDKPDAVVLDFFAGSGTTAHAVMRLNHQDGGCRQCILVTNNEVSEDEERLFRARGLRPGDPEWESQGICEYITKPRIKAAMTGQTLEGLPVSGEYKFIDEFPMSDGFGENAEFFDLEYLTPLLVEHNRQFTAIAPILWLRAGAEGPRIDHISEEGWAVTDTYGVLQNMDRAAAFTRMVSESRSVRIAFIITDDDRRFQMVYRELPSHVQAVRLYETYLANFETTRRGG